MYSLVVNAFHMWGGGDTLTLTHTSWSNTQILHKQYCLPMIFSSLMRQLSLAHTQTRVVQCLWFRTKEWPLKGIMGWNKAQWGPSSCRLLPGNTVGLFICYNAMYVSLCHLAGASLRPVVDQWQCQIPRLSLPVDQVRQSLPNNPALCYSSPDFFFLFSSVLEVCGCTSFFFFTFSVGRKFFVMGYLTLRQCSLVKWETFSSLMSSLYGAIKETLKMCHLRLYLSSRLFVCFELLCPSFSVYAANFLHPSIGTKLKHRISFS